MPLTNISFTPVDNDTAVLRIATTSGTMNYMATNLTRSEALTLAKQLEDWATICPAPTDGVFIHHINHAAAVADYLAGRMSWPELLHRLPAYRFFYLRGQTLTEVNKHSGARYPITDTTFADIIARNMHNKSTSQFMVTPIA